MKGVIILLTVYLSPIGDMQFENSNDRFFDRNVLNYKIDDEVKQLIKTIDNTEYRDNGYIVAKFSPEMCVSITELSTGCKAAINVYLNPDIIFNAVECGSNALAAICKFTRGKIYLPTYIPCADFENTIEIISNKGRTTVNNECDLSERLGRYYGF